jgi:outer membrane receptor protein involved in Fe transport
VIDQNGTIPLYQQDVNNFNDGLNLEYTFQVDYVHPFSEKLKMETGLKTVIRRIESDYTTEVKANDEANFVVAPDLTDLFNYDQDVYAGFLSFNVGLGEKWGLVAGARYELTEIGGDFRSENPSFEFSYQNLLPSIILNRKLNMFSNLKASYTKRIQRPSLFFINPFTAISDPNNLQIGNPELEPEIVDQYELAYNTYVKGIVVNASVYLRQTSDLIESFLQIDQSGIAGQTTYLNIGSANNLGVNFFTQATIFKILTLRGNLNFNRYEGTGFVGGEQLERTADVWNGFASGSLKLSEKLRIDLFGFFRGQNQTLQGTTPSFGILSTGLNYDVSERTQFGIRIVEPFNENKFFDSELRGRDFNQISSFSIPFRSFGLSFTHKFGQIDFKTQNRRSRVKNDDQKGGGENSQF